MHKSSLILFLLISTLCISPNEAGKLKKLLKLGLGAGALLGSHHHHVPIHLIGLGLVGLGLAAHAHSGFGGQHISHHETFVPYPVHYHSASFHVIEDGHGGGYW